MMTGKQKTGRPALSSGLMQMKFMQKSRRQGEEENSRDQRQTHAKRLKTSGAHTEFIVEESYSEVEKLRYGRMSFKGFNPEVEKLMSHYETLQNKSEEERPDEADVTAKEMADRYSSAVVTVGKKFKTKRERNELDQPGTKQQPARKFIKPSE